MDLLRTHTHTHTHARARAHHHTPSLVPQPRVFLVRRADAALVRIGQHGDDDGDSPQKEQRAETKYPPLGKQCVGKTVWYRG
jgi:hypothetical protein